MKELIVSDSTALIVLTKTNLMALLLESYKEIIIPKAVQMEVGIALDKKIKVVKPTDTKKIAKLSKLLDRGESESIALAIELNAPLLIDERKGRKIALAEGLKIIGVLGLIIHAFYDAKITHQEALEFAKKLEKAGFYIAPALQKQFETLLDQYKNLWKQ